MTKVLQGSQLDNVLQTMLKIQQILNLGSGWPRNSEQDRPEMERERARAQTHTAQECMFSSSLGLNETDKT